ncbi:MAG: HAD family phosphatase [Erysipelotrichaceae bacterium]|nr:HAD family phosphatase [Erysipelotrichaceae bacterium]
MNRKYKLVSLDIDGTLVGDSGKASKKTIDVMRKVREKGILLVLNTGRTTKILEDAELPEDTYDYACTINGQYITDMRTGEVQSHEILEPEQVEELVQLGNKYACVMRADADRWSVNAANLKGKILYNTMRTLMQMKIMKMVIFMRNPIEIHKLSEVPREGVAKMVYISTHKILLDLQKHVPPQYEAAMVLPNMLDVQRKGISKIGALKEVFEREGLTAEDAVAIGDGENDIGILDLCGYAVAMDNAFDIVKQHTDEVTDSNNDDGVANWLEKTYLQGD